MRGPLAFVLGVAALLPACGGAQFLPTTLFHAPLAPGASPSEDSWITLARAGAGTGQDTLAFAGPIGEGEWIAWTTQAIGVEGAGTLVLARRTELGLEAQAAGAHEGPSVRASVRVLTVGPARVIIVESSSAQTSTDRDAWLYTEERGRIVPLGIDQGDTRLRVRAEQRAALEGGWCRASTFTATFEAEGAELVVHEHASVREIAIDRPELPARSTYEVERARRLRWSGGVLRSDRPSLFDAGE